MKVGDIVTLPDGDLALVKDNQGPSSVWVEKVRDLSVEEFDSSELVPLEITQDVYRTLRAESEFLNKKHEKLKAQLAELSEDFAYAYDSYKLIEEKLLDNFMENK